MISVLNRENIKPFTLLILVMVLFSYSSFASAAMNSNVMDEVLDKYQAAASAWSGVMIKYGTWLFWSLALISMVWTFGMMAMQGDGINTALAEIVRFFVVIGFFWYLLSNGPAIAMAIIKSMWQIGAEAIGQNAAFTPGGVTQIGFDIFFKVLDQSSVWSPVDSTAGIILGIIILGILALVGVNLLLLFISAWVLVYGGIFFLGFGGSRWTSDMAINFFKTVLSTGAQLMSMVLIIGIGKSILDSYYTGMSSAISLKEMGVIFVVALALLYLSNKIPALIGGLAGGSTGGIGSFGAGALVGAAASAAAIAATGGALAAAGAANAAGGASALKAAFESAQAAMAEESGSGGSGGSGGGFGGGEDTGSVDASGGQPSGGSGGSSAGSSSGSASGGSQGFASSFSRAGRMASHMASSLADGMAARNAAKHDSKISAAKDTIAQTAGGQLASQIRAQTAARQSGPMVSDDTAMQGAFASNDNASTNQFSGDGLSGSQPDTGNVSGESQAPQGSDEYEQFKNKQIF
ncbi:P-type conjugative transfer protein TrbL [Escherichia coli]|nr:P-type conjugative transfer protein TrbL [Salmonella enterica]EFL1538961.1 P-type conjugative transfer protein TrbL [Escherichia coli]EGX5232328.1 P-type conjugative transfer protein TrbL [Salmonella enterica]EIJ6017694.1 P-type conjugative transfer protein TrbL [Escherichia coli]ELR5899068.1 P-type conjugative transfer protein TrbL [Escherichia coli]